MNMFETQPAHWAEVSLSDFSTTAAKGDNIWLVEEKSGDQYNQNVVIRIGTHFLRVLPKSYDAIRVAEDEKWSTDNPLFLTKPALTGPYVKSKKGWGICHAVLGEILPLTITKDEAFDPKLHHLPGDVRRLAPHLYLLDTDRLLEIKEGRARFFRLPITLKCWRHIKALGDDTKVLLADANWKTRCDKSMLYDYSSAKVLAEVNF